MKAKHKNTKRQKKYGGVSVGLILAIIHEILVYAKYGKTTLQ